MTEYEKKLILELRLEICDNCIYGEEEKYNKKKCGNCPVNKLLCLAEKENKNESK